MWDESRRLSFLRFKVLMAAAAAAAVVAAAPRTLGDALTGEHFKHIDTASPCPPHALFVLSDVHQAPYCVCERRTRCQGYACERGNQRNVPAFGQHAIGFPVNCTDCACWPSSYDTSPTDLLTHHMNASAHGLTEANDQAFRQRCHLADNYDPASVPPPRPLSRLHWVHIPKTGTSFTATVYNYACRTFTGAHAFRNQKGLHANATFLAFKQTTCDTCLDPKALCRKSQCVRSIAALQMPGVLHHANKHVWERECAAMLLEPRGHTPLSRRYQDHQDRHQPQATGARVHVGLFRDPRRRLLSAFNYHRHAFGLRGKKIKKRLRDLTTLKAFATFPGIAGCQVKHLIGYECASDDVALTIGHVLQAIGVVQRTFAFLGITDDYDTSVCLFHRMLGTLPHADEFIHTRDSSQYAEVMRHRGYTTLPRDAWTTLDVKHDRHDWLLYVVVMDTFVRRLQQYGLRAGKHTLHEHTAITQHCRGWIALATQHTPPPSTSSALRTAVEECWAFQSHIN